MALLPFNEKDDEAVKQAGAQGADPQAGAGIQTSGESALVGSGSPTQPGSGGVAKPSGGFTNIQEYLKVNQGDTSGANALNSKVGSVIDNEQKTLTDQVTKTRGQIDQEKGKILPTSAVDQMLNAGAKPPAPAAPTQNPVKPVSSGGPAKLPTQQNDMKLKLGAIDQTNWNDIVGSLQSGMNAKYAGPDSFYASIGDEVKNHGAMLGDESKFDQFMNGVHTSAAPGRVGTGILALQKQLDRANPNLTNTRSDLQNRYKSLNDYLTGEVKGVNDTIAATRGEVDSSGEKLKSHLNTRSTESKSNIQKAVDAFEAEEAAIRSGQNKVYRNNRPTGNDDPRGVENRTYAWQTIKGGPGGGNKVADFSVDTDQFRKYRGSKADMSTVGGVDSDRNRFNLIMEALGQKDQAIADLEDAQHGAWLLDEGAYTNHWNNLINSIPRHAKRTR